MDIVELLRESADLDAAEHVPAEVVQMQIDAANEIERLREALDTVARVSNDPAIVTCAKRALTGYAYLMKGENDV